MSILVNKEAPNFTAQAVMPNGVMESLSLDQFRGHYVVLFFWPLDFTFVCPTEIIAHNKRVAAFEERDVQLIGCSIDSQFTHAAWRNTPVDKGGIGEVDFPMVADVKREIASSFGILHDAGIALRASFLIDKDGIVQHQVANNLPLGRNVDEMLRIVDALQFTEEHGEVCPAGWNKGDTGMAPNTEGVASYLAAHAEAL
ncbi:MAG: redoxin domain-containing protein [Phycisphaerales bacterium]|jgi:peroxiredoxin (alkyl hydroperoxide reductase subunit C)|tara:strand:- start:6992 stop:7588 length:597 start_codon:yes stop_codon:yes gene_type:complete